MRIPGRLALILVLGVLFAASIPSAAAADSTRPLLDLKSLDAHLLKSTDAQVSVQEPKGQSVLILQSDGVRPAQVSIQPEGPWNLSDCCAVSLLMHNAGKTPQTVRACLANADSDGLRDSVRNAIEVQPDQRQELTVPLLRRPQDPGYEPFKPFYMYSKVIRVRDNTVDASAIARLMISIDGGGSGDAQPAVLEISDIRGVVTAAGGSPATQPFFPFIDRYGQYIHSHWPGKIYADRDFAQRREEETRERANWPGPVSWDRYGGWAGGPTLRATGFFYPTKHDGKWWLVDPEGKLFFSYGPTGVGLGGDPSPVNDRENWFLDLPSREDPQFGRFYSARHGATYMYYQKRDWVGFDFAAANLLRKYGSGYEQVVAQLSHERLRSWGFNSIGNWSSPKVYCLHRTPYTVAIHYGSAALNDRLPDVFDPSWPDAVRRRMEHERDTTANDAWNIGYFVDNERGWGWRPRAAGVGEATLQVPPTAPAKQRFVELLKQRYADIGALNKSWSTDHATWDALSQSRQVPDMKNKNVLSDCGDFGMAFAEKYFSTVRDAVKAVAPHNLYLGCRFHGHIDPQLVQLAGKYCDVISYNIYDKTPDGRLDQYKSLDRPFLSSEWGIESDPLQTPFRGGDQKYEPQQRVAAMVQYAEHAIRYPNLVGAHFFQYRDQPISGRPDGEAVLRGFVNIADTPNFDLVHANRALAYDLYEKRAKTQR